MLGSIGLNGENSKMIILKEKPEYIILLYIFCAADWAISVKRRDTELIVLKKKKVERVLALLRALSLWTPMVVWTAVSMGWNMRGKVRWLFHTSKN